MTLAIYDPADTGDLSPYLFTVNDTGEIRFPAPSRRPNVDETLILPFHAPPAPPRHAVPTVYRPERVRPDRYRGVRRAPRPVWSYLLTAVGAVLLVEAVAALVALAVLA
ncbi:MAG: hypothetical protein JWO11_4461 [Nocardioides sp.]|nr:hypothetical protein [Nocardioides sp.]